MANKMAWRPCATGISDQPQSKMSKSAFDWFGAIGSRVVCVCVRAKREPAFRAFVFTHALRACIVRGMSRARSLRTGIKWMGKLFVDEVSHVMEISEEELRLYASQNGTTLSPIHTSTLARAWGSQLGIERDAMRHIITQCLPSGSTVTHKEKRARDDAFRIDLPETSTVRRAMGPASDKIRTRIPGSTVGMENSVMIVTVPLATYVRGVQKECTRVVRHLTGRSGGISVGHVVRVVARAIVAPWYSPTALLLLELVIYCIFAWAFVWGILAE